MTELEARYRLDKRKVRRAFERAAAGYDQVAVLQREVGERLLERLQWIRLQPQWVLDLGAGTGVGTRALSQRYKTARVLAMDIAEGMLQRTRKRGAWLNKPRCVCGDMEALPLADHSLDMVFSNLTLQWANDLDRVFAEVMRVLKPGGMLLFSTFGPDTLKELRASFAGVDERTHVNVFMDLHDVGDAMARAGLAEPVMDRELFTLTYADVRGVMTDLKGMGAHNVTAGRPRGLMGRGRLQALQEAYERFRRDGELPASYEVVYGHAWAPDASKQTRNDRGMAYVSVDGLLDRGR